MPIPLVRRRAEALVEEALGHFRVVVLHGPRQAGKSTLAGLLSDRLHGTYVTLDRPVDLAAAVADPELFIDQLSTPLVIDEIQRAGQPLVLAVKLKVDGDQRPGRYLLTGSTNFLTVPTISESLAGRVALVQLWPFSLGERLGGPDDFLDRCFEDPAGLAAHGGPGADRQDYLEWLCQGGFPSVQQLPDRARRQWFAQYVQTVLDREILVAADIRRADALRRMVRYHAANTAREINLSDVSRRLGINVATASSYQPWLETTFLVHRIPAWSRNLTAKVVRRPKLFMTDTGLAAAILGKSPAALARHEEPSTGPLIETLVANELARQCTWSRTPARLHHFRDSDGAEVDLVVESDDGAVVAVEVKATRSPRREDARWLVLLRDRLDLLGDDFRAGVVFHTGPRRLKLADRILALPISDLWS